MAKYTAFICYRHKPLDAKAAKAIQRRLEYYVIPSRIKKDKGIKKVGRCFRDENKLQASHNLSESIKNALKNSKWLIVICTPDLPKSKWCLTEIETFIKLHGRENILTVLLAGEPKECFPEILCVEEQQPDGIYIKKEPFATDIRSDNTIGMNFKLHNEKLRLLAPILGVKFDDLKHQATVRLQRIIIIMSFLAILLFGLLYAYVNYKNKQLEEQLEKTEFNLRRAIEGEAEAQRQAGIAKDNEDEAKRQAKIAEDNEKEAQRQAKIAKDNEEEAQR